MEEVMDEFLVRAARPASRRGVDDAEFAELTGLLAAARPVEVRGRGRSKGER